MITSEIITPRIPEKEQQPDLLGRLHSLVENSPKIGGSADIPYRDWPDDDED